MKKLVTMLCGLIMCACVGSSYAGVVDFKPSVDRLEFDVAVPTHLQKTDFTSTSKFAENLTVSSDFRISLIDTKIGIFGIEGLPVWDIRNHNINANFGINYKPFGIKYLEFHYDHDMNIDITHVSNTTWKSNQDIVGLRFIVKE